jgi:hypothetical protein
MRLLFSSSEADLVEEMGRRLLAAGIACEIRYRPERPGSRRFRGYRELWIERDKTPHWAEAFQGMNCDVALN